MLPPPDNPSPLESARWLFLNTYYGAARSISPELKALRIILVVLIERELLRLDNSATALRPEALTAFSELIGRPLTREEFAHCWDFLDLTGRFATRADLYKRRSAIESSLPAAAPLGARIPADLVAFLNGNAA